MPMAAIGELELDYERSGSGPPLLLIMGMSGTALHWGDAFLDALRRDFEVISYDHRGVGASSRLEGALTITQLARDAAGLLGALGVRRRTCSASRWAAWSPRSWRSGNPSESAR